MLLKCYIISSLISLINMPGLRAGAVVQQNACHGCIKSNIRKIHLKHSLSQTIVCYMYF